MTWASTSSLVSAKIKPSHRLLKGPGLCNISQWIRDAKSICCLFVATFMLCFDCRTAQNQVQREYRSYMWVKENRRVIFSPANTSLHSGHGLYLGTTTGWSRLCGSPASATKGLEPMQFALGTISRKVFWAVSCEQAVLFQLVGHCSHCMVTYSHGKT